MRNYLIRTGKSILIVFSIIVPLASVTYFSSDNLPLKVGTVNSIWGKYSPGSITHVLKEILNTKSNYIKDQWNNSEIEKLALLIYYMGYKKSGITPATVFGIIEQESRFNQYAINNNRSRSGRIKSRDYFLTQQNSTYSKRRYYNLRNRIRNGSFNTIVTRILNKRFKYSYRVYRLKDPIVSIAMLYQTFYECSYACKGRSNYKDRLMLCYNKPVLAKRLSTRNLYKNKYFQKVSLYKKQYEKMF